MVKKKKEKKEKWWKRKVKSKKILKPTQVVLRIKEEEPVEDVSHYFNKEWEDAKKSMF